MIHFREKIFSLKSLKSGLVQRLIEMGVCRSIRTSKVKKFGAEFTQHLRKTKSQVMTGHKMSATMTSRSHGEL